MAEEKQVEDEITILEREPPESTTTWLDLAGGILGLAVFVVGVVLIYGVYTQASAMYREFEPEITAAQMGPDSPDQAEANPEGPGAVQARPDGTPLAKVGMKFGLRFLVLLLVAFLGCLIAAMGAKLAGAHRGKRT